MSVHQRTEDQQRAWDLLGAVEDHQKVQAWLLEADAAGPIGVQRRPRSAKYAKRRILWAMAASVMLMLCAAIPSAYRYFDTQHYETRIGEQRDVLLSDGSKITLNTNTAVSVRYSRAARRIELQRGEALFVVKHQSERPFEVTAGVTLTRAVGTEFNVDLRAGGVTVSVLEGAVQVSAIGNALGSVAIAHDKARDPVRVAVARGEALEVRSQEHRIVEGKADVKRIDAWRARRLEFSDAPLEEAVAEFNRYSTTRMELGTQELKSVRISGIFYTDDAAGFLYSLQQALGVQVNDSTNPVILTRPVR